MRKAMEEDPFGRELFLAGEAAPPGRYKRLDSWQVVELNQANILPAALDGHMTCYTRIEIWNDNQLSDVSIVLLPEANV